MIFVDIISGILFIISSGLLFGGKHKGNWALTLIAGFIAVASTFYLFRDSLRPDIAQLFGVKPEKVSDSSTAPSPKRDAVPALSPGQRSTGDDSSVFPISRSWSGQIKSHNNNGNNPSYVEIYRNGEGGELMERYEGCVARLEPRFTKGDAHRYASFADLSLSGWGDFPFYACKAHQTAEAVDPNGSILDLIAYPNDSKRLRYRKYYATMDVEADGDLTPE